MVLDKSDLRTASQSQLRVVWNCIKIAWLVGHIFYNKSEGENSFSRLVSHLSDSCVDDSEDSDDDDVDDYDKNYNKSDDMI